MDENAYNLTWTAPAVAGDGVGPDDDSSQGFYYIHSSHWLGAACGHLTQTSASGYLFPARWVG